MFRVSVAVLLAYLAPLLVALRCGHAFAAVLKIRSIGSA